MAAEVGSLCSKNNNLSRAGEKRPLLDENPDFGLKTLKIWERPRNTVKAKKGLFRAKVPKTDSQHPFSELNFKTSSE